MTEKQRQLAAKHGHPIAFAHAIRVAGDAGEVTIEEGNAAVEKYQREWAEAGPPQQSEADELEALRKFKAYVHKRLDDAGVPVDPESPHKAEGCRIGGRLDIVLRYFNPPTAPPADDAHVAPGCQLFSDPTKPAPQPGHDANGNLVPLSDEIATILTRIKADATRVKEMVEAALFRGVIDPKEKWLFEQLDMPMDHAARACERYLNVVGG